MKIERNWTYWKLIEANFGDHEVCFALTDNKKAEPIFQLTNEINEDWKIILMPLREGADSPTQEEFQKMEEYFWAEGYFDYLELWFNWLNDYPAKLVNINAKGRSLEHVLLIAKLTINKKWGDYDTIKEYIDDDEE